jgi:hypothetical protein
MMPVTDFVAAVHDRVDEIFATSWPRTQSSTGMKMSATRDDTRSKRLDAGDDQRRKHEEHPQGRMVRTEMLVSSDASACDTKGKAWHDSTQSKH